MLAIIVSKIKKSPLQYNFARKLAHLDLRIIVSKWESAVKMFQQVLNRLIEGKWKTSQQADTELTQYWKFISETKKYYHNKFATYSFAQERLDNFLSELLGNQKEYKELWVTLMIFLTLSHGQAAVERGFSVNKEVLAPNPQEMSLRALKTYSQFPISKED